MGDFLGLKKFNSRTFGRKEFRHGLGLGLKQVGSVVSVLPVPAPVKAAAVTEAVAGDMLMKS